MQQSGILKLLEKLQRSFGNILLRETIYRNLGLKGFDDARPALDAYMESVKQYKRNTYRPLSQRILKRLHSEWDFWFEEFGYPLNQDFPGSASLQ